MRAVTSSRRVPAAGLLQFEDGDSIQRLCILSALISKRSVRAWPLADSNPNRPAAVHTKYQALQPKS